jgi:hypothetical protein
VFGSHLRSHHDCDERLPGLNSRDATSLVTQCGRFGDKRTSQAEKNDVRDAPNVPHREVWGHCGLVNRSRRAEVIYAINYDLKRPGQDYNTLYEAIKGCGAWWHHLGSTWLVDTSLNAQGIWGRLAPHVDQNDTVLVIGVSRDKQGWLTKDAWEWINSRGAKMAA